MVGRAGAGVARTRPVALRATVLATSAGDGVRRAGGPAGLAGSAGAATEAAAGARGAPAGAEESGGATPTGAALRSAIRVRTSRAAVPAA